MAGLGLIPDALPPVSMQWIRKRVPWSELVSLLH